MKDNPWMQRRVVAFAHQGGSYEAPSSTLYAIRHAVQSGAPAIELDVHATKDRVIVVCHDETVDRTTNHHGEIADFTLAELREMDNAYWFIKGDVVSPGRADNEYVLRGRAPADTSFAIATLEEVAEATPGVVLNMDIKRSSPDVEPYEQLLADELARLDVQRRVIVASFHDGAIQSFRSLAPDILTSAATNETAEFFFAVQADAPVPELPVCAFQVPAQYDGITVVDEKFVGAAHANGIAVHVWTINDVAEMGRLVDLGVDGLISDTPSALVGLLKERGCAWRGLTN